jgi:hypothetical protein
VDPSGDGVGGLTATGLFCGSCGAQSSTTAKFCGECGTRLTQPKHPFEIVSVAPEPPVPPFRPRLGDGDWRNLRKARQRLAESRTVKGPPTRSDPFGVARLSWSSP